LHFDEELEKKISEFGV